MWREEGGVCGDVWCRCVEIQEYTWELCVFKLLVFVWVCSTCMRYVVGCILARKGINVQYKSICLHVLHDSLGVFLI